MLDILMNRRSIRKYEEKEVEKEKIDSILKAALLSPSSRSRKPWEFVVVTEEGKLAKLSELRKMGGKFLKQSPVAIVIISDVEKCDVWVEDCTITGIIMQLEAEKLGLSSCWVQVRERMHNDVVTAEDYVKDILNIPSKYAVLSIISIGYKDEEKKAHSDDELDFNKVHYNEF